MNRREEEAMLECLCVLLGLLLGDPGRGVERWPSFGEISVAPDEGETSVAFWELLRRFREPGVAIALDFESLDAEALTRLSIPLNSTEPVAVERSAIRRTLTELLAPAGIDVLTIETSKADLHFLHAQGARGDWHPHGVSQASVVWIELERSRAGFIVDEIVECGLYELLALETHAVHVVGVRGKNPRIVSSIAEVIVAMDRRPPSLEADELEVYRAIAERWKRPIREGVICGDSRYTVGHVRRMILLMLKQQSENGAATPESRELARAYMDHELLEARAATECLPDVILAPGDVPETSPTGLGVGRVYFDRRRTRGWVDLDGRFRGTEPVVLHREHGRWVLDR